MRNTILAIVLLLSLLPATGAAAEEDYDSGAFLLKECRKAADTHASDRWNRAFCVGFVSGFVEGHRGDGGRDFCLPEEVTTGKLVTSVVRFLEENPEALTLPRGEALAAALTERFPCDETDDDQKAKVK